MSLEQRATEEWLQLHPSFSVRAKGQRDMNKVGRQYADALDKMNAAEAKMRRAFRNYERARATVRRLDKILDKESQCD